MPRLVGRLPEYVLDLLYRVIQSSWTVSIKRGCWEDHLEWRKLLQIHHRCLVTTYAAIMRCLQYELLRKYR